MFKKLKSQLFSNETQQLFKKAKIDKSLQLIHPKYITLISSSIMQPKRMNEVLNCISRGINSSDYVLRIKSFTILHACVRSNFNEEMCELVLSYDVNDNQKIQQKNNSQQQSLKTYIKQNIINFYIIYLKKICVQNQTFQFMIKFIHSLNKNQLKHLSIDDLTLEVVHHGFKLLNLSQYLLQSLQFFNKMGRYHIEHQQVISVYLQILNDFELFNKYIMKSVEQIICKNAQRKAKLKMQITQKDILLNKNQSQPNHNKKTSKKQITNQQAQQSKHHYLYLTECQKISDKLYQFFHIRYYYPIIKNYITIPQFLNVKNKQHNRVKRRARKVDKQLVRLVSMNKYQKQSSMNFKFERTLTLQHVGKVECFNMSLPNIGNISIEDQQFQGNHGRKNKQSLSYMNLQYQLQ